MIRWPVPVRRRRSANRRTLPPVAGVWRRFTHCHTFPYNTSVITQVAESRVLVQSLVAPFVSTSGGAGDPCFFWP